MASAEPGPSWRPVTIRPARSEDLESILDLADARRRQYATYQPRFWRPAADAIARQRPYLAALIGDADVIALVAVIDDAVVSYAIGRLTGSPPVYDPGGATCLVDDFTVADAAAWSTTGVELLRSVRRIAHQRGATQIVVITGHLDAAKRSALTASGLSIASEWWVGAVAN